MASDDNRQRVEAGKRRVVRGLVDSLPPLRHTTFSTRKRAKRATLMFQVGLFILVAGFLGDDRAKSDEPSKSRPSVKPGRFSRTELLRRFDKNRDGKLDKTEKATLRDAFGSMDVPMLPAKPYSFTQARRPDHIKPSQLRRLDNTPKDNPLTDHGAALGRVLFYDKHLSQNNTVACATCHRQRAAFADPRRFSRGFQGRHTKRNSMGLANIRYTHLKGHRPGFFWDERAATLEAQVLMPIQDKVEMGMELKALEKKLQKLLYYPSLFEAAFGSTKVTRGRIGKAVAQFMRAMVSLNSKFDRAAAAAANEGDGSANFKNFTAQENMGRSLFMDGIGGITEFACAMCHVPPTFNMDKASNIGLDLRYKDSGLGALDRSSNDPFTPSNDGKFKAPSLRNVALTAPYMHDGRFKTLEKVVEHYSQGVHPHKNLGLAFEAQNTGKPTSGFQYSKQERAAIVAFLKTLTDEDFISDPRFSDPFVRIDKHERIE